MLETLMIVGTIGVVYYIMYWSIRHDRVQNPSEHSGLLRMRPPAEEPTPKPSASARGRRRRGADAPSATTGGSRQHGSGRGSRGVRRR